MEKLFYASRMVLSIENVSLTPLEKFGREYRSGVRMQHMTGAHTIPSSTMVQEREQARSDVRCSVAQRIDHTVTGSTNGNDSASEQEQEGDMTRTET